MTTYDICVLDDTWVVNLINKNGKNMSEKQDVIRDQLAALVKTHTEAKEKHKSENTWVQYRMDQAAYNLAEYNKIQHDYANKIALAEEALDCYDEKQKSTN